MEWRRRRRYRRSGGVVVGNRANVLVLDDTHPDIDKGVWLYTHNGGALLPWVVQSVLRRGQRWKDAPYLARMLLCAMLDGDLDGDSGVGITSRMTTSNHAIIMVDPSSHQQVSFHSEDRSLVYADWAFDEFIELGDELMDAWKRGRP